MTENDMELEQQTLSGETITGLICDQCGELLVDARTQCPECGNIMEQAPVKQEDEEDEVEESLIHWGDEIVYPEDVCNV